MINNVSEFLSVKKMESDIKQPMDSTIVSNIGSGRATPEILKSDAGNRIFNKANSINLDELKVDDEN